VVVLAAVVAIADRVIMRVRSGARLLHEVAGNLRTQEAEGAEKARKQLRQAEASEQVVRVPGKTVLVPTTAGADATP